MKKALLLLCLFISLVANASKVIDGIYYELKSSDNTAKVVQPSGTTLYSGKVTIPSTVVYSGIEYSVTSIGYRAFASCTGLTSISIPSSVIDIGICAFENCSGLTSVIIPPSVRIISSNAFGGCTGLTSISIPSSVIAIGSCAFGGCSALTSVTIPSSVTNIGSSTFSGCSALTSVTIPSSVTNIGSSTFSGCSGLMNVTIPSSVTNIDNRAFEYCSGLTNVTIPSSVTSIGEGAFLGCSGLTNVTIPPSVTSIGYSAFKGCTSLPVIDNLRYADTYLVEAVEKSLSTYNIKQGTRFIGTSAFEGCSGLTNLTIPSSVIDIGYLAFSNCSGLSSLMVIPSSVTSIGSFAFYYCHCSLYFKGIPSSIDKYTFSWYSGSVLAPSDFKDAAVNSGLSSNRFFSNDGSDWGEHVITTYLKGFSCYEPFVETILNFKDIRFYLEDGTPLSYTKTDDHYTVKGLNMGTSNHIRVTHACDIVGEVPETTCGWLTVKTKSPSPSISYSSTQSAVTIKGVRGVRDETCTPEKEGILYDGVEYTDFPVVISGLYPGECVTLQPFAYYNGIRYDSNQTGSASSISLSINKQSNSSASNLFLNGKYTEGDAKITEEMITINGKTYSGNTVNAVGLDPNTKYTVSYSLKANDHEFSQQATFTTPGLTLVTKQPKVICVGNVIVAAEANIDDAETNVGFEWRRTDWTDDFASNTGVAYMYNGHMEGYIRSLYTEKLWKYRPYYLSDSGKYYYGDWVGLDPTNTSYFEATVHTYNQITVKGNTALVKGYALRGTDDIKVQGFVYWKRVSSAKALDGRTYAASVPGNAKIVEVKGQIMTATLSDLDYSSEYSYMAFVTTNTGETFYGEEMTFQTGENATGINDLVLDSDSKEPAEILGYYDLNGRRVLQPQHGFYIIRYSDGTKRKVMRR